MTDFDVTIGGDSASEREGSLLQSSQAFFTEFNSDGEEIENGGGIRARSLLDFTGEEVRDMGEMEYREEVIRFFEHDYYRHGDV